MNNVKIYNPNYNCIDSTKILICKKKDYYYKISCVDKKKISKFFNQSLPWSSFNKCPLLVFSNIIKNKNVNTGLYDYSNKNSNNRKWKYLGSENFLNIVEYNNIINSGQYYPYLNISYSFINVNNNKKKLYVDFDEKNIFISFKYHSFFSSAKPLINDRLFKIVSKRIEENSCIPPYNTIDNNTPLSCIQDETVLSHFNIQIENISNLYVKINITNNSPIYKNPLIYVYVNNDCSTGFINNYWTNTENGFEDSNNFYQYINKPLLQGDNTCNLIFGLSCSQKSFNYRVYIGVDSTLYCSEIFSR